MFIRIQTIFFLCTTAVPALPVQNDIFHTGFLPKPHISVQARQLQPTALSKTATQGWKQVGSTRYKNTAPDSVTVQWSYFSRDTMLYDASGNMILKKTTLAHSGWGADSVWFIDSLIYDNGDLTEGVHFFYDHFGSSGTLGQRNTYGYVEGGKAFIDVVYDFQAPNSWIPDFKDSSVYYAASAQWKDYSKLIEYYSSRYIPLTQSWKNESFLARVDAECDSRKLVLQGWGRHFPRTFSDTIRVADMKSIMTFSSSDWTEQTMVEIKQQERDSATGAYIDAYKHSTSSGYEEICQWDSTGKNMVCWYKSYRDSHGNDTLQYQRQNMEKGYYTRLSRSYDDNGNNIVTITSFSSSDDENSWEITRKDTNYFAQINVPIIRSVQAPSPQKVSMTRSPGIIRFSAPGITALNLYDASGRLVTSMRQRAAASILFDLSSARCGSILSGMYIAELVSKNGKNAFTVPVHR